MNEDKFVMTYPLAIFASVLGDSSDTFLRRHMQDLLPAGTVVVANNLVPLGQWKLDCPTLLFENLRNNGLKTQVLHSIARRCGIQRFDRRPIVKRFLKDHGVKVIMGEYLDWPLQWLDIARELGIRFFAHAHGYDVSRTLRDPKWLVAYSQYRLAEGVITMSRANRERLVHIGMSAEKVHVVYYGVDVPNEPICRNEKENIRCVAVGRMVAKKAPILTLDSFRRAVKVYPNLRLDYVGSGALLPAVQQFIRAFNLEDRITLHGDQPNEVVQSLMRDADIFLQHSMTDPETGDEEGLPVAILEAMGNSLPVVSTRHAGIPEAVVDGSTGYLVGEGDSMTMADHIVTLARQHDLRSDMGKAGWQRAKEHFSWEQERADLLRILGLADNGRPSHL